MVLNFSFASTGVKNVLKTVQKLIVFYKNRIYKTGNGREVVVAQRSVQILLNDEHSPRRSVERKRKAMLGSRIVAANLSAYALTVVTEGELDNAGLSDTAIPRLLGSKRAIKKRILYNFLKVNSVRGFAKRRPWPAMGNKQANRRRVLAAIVALSQEPDTPRMITALELIHRRIALLKKRLQANNQILVEFAKLKMQCQMESEARRQPKQITM